MKCYTLQQIITENYLAVIFLTVLWKTLSNLINSLQVTRREEEWESLLITKINPRKYQTAYFLVNMLCICLNLVILFCTVQSRTVSNK